MENNDLSFEMLLLMFDEGRLYYKIGDTMIKIPYNENGIRMNQDEWEVYQNADDELKGLLAKCIDLDENNWLSMEYVKDYSFDWESYKNGSYINCLKFDYSQEKEIKFDCDFDCANCMFNFHFLKEADLEKMKKAPYTYRWLVGQGKDLMCKFYSYTDAEIKEDQFIFNEMYTDLFDKYLEEAEYDTLFAEWIKRQRKIPKHESQVNGSFVAIANRTRRRMLVKRHNKKLNLQEE